MSVGRLEEDAVKAPRPSTGWRRGEAPVERRGGEKSRATQWQWLNTSQTSSLINSWQPHGLKQPLPLSSRTLQKLFSLSSEKKTNQQIDINLSSLYYEVLKTERDVLISELRGLGVNIMDWEPDMLLSTALAGARGF